MSIFCNVLDRLGCGMQGVGAGGLSQIYFNPSDPIGIMLHSLSSKLSPGEKVAFTKRCLGPDDNT